MGLSFPTVPGRRAFGGLYKNNAEVVDVDTDVDQSIGNALFWTVAGAAQTATKAEAFLRGADGVLLAASEVFNPLANPALHPSSARLSAGSYQLVFQLAYQDEDSLADPNSPPRPLTLWAVKVFPQGPQTLTSASVAQVTPTAWAAAATLGMGALRASAGQIWQVTTPGTTAAPAPTGTGPTFVDGGAVGWKWLGTASTVYVVAVVLSADVNVLLEVW